MIKMTIVIIGPIEAKPTKPNDESRLFPPPLVKATPAPRAKINGTVALPVVTPPASKINGKNGWFLGSACKRQISIKTIR